MSSEFDPVEHKKAIAKLEQHVRVDLDVERIDEAELMEKLQAFNQFLKTSLSDGDLVSIARRLGEQLAIDVDLGSVITSKDFEPWLEARKWDIDWGRRNAYDALLAKQGRAPRVIDKTNELTDKILDLAGDPTKKGAWARRGLALGDVQSGKTATYLALFNKAADMGYRLFILLAGNTEALRQQTQRRVDEAFIGRDSSIAIPRKGSKVTPKKNIGVGLLRPDLVGQGMTTVLRDFRRSSYEATNISIPANAAQPFVFVVKKNKSVLEKLTAWLRDQPSVSGGKLSIPVMVLDDECDYASINTNNPDTDPTAINQAIRDVLGMFSRSSYVAFTATPFANIFIDHSVENDLFPRDYVYALEAPTNYVGSIKTFGTAEDVKTQGLVSLEDVDELISLGHKSSHVVKKLPASLLDSVDSFLIVNAIRDLRGQEDEPRAMLVNVSRYKAVQRQVYDLLSDRFAETRRAITLHYADDSGTEHSVITRLARAFESGFADSKVSWTDVLKQLPQAIDSISVKLFNSDVDKRLDSNEEAWEEPPRLIAVGGDVLSRGLTLEGLCVSYFYRRVGASDTLMQMARWFGYRDGYQDLCRIWINNESADNYRFAADSVDELKADLRDMLRQQLTPEDFGLAVRKHPGALLITARNKMRNAEEAKRTIGLVGRNLETTRLTLDHGRNRVSFEQFVATLDGKYTYHQTPSNKWHRWRSVDAEIVADYLEEYAESVPNSDPFFRGTALSGWARSAKARTFPEWDIVVASGGAALSDKPLGRGRQIKHVMRRLRREGEIVQVSGKRLRLAGSSDLAGLLDPEVRRAAEDEFKAQGDSKHAAAKGHSEKIYYRYLPRPSLIIYPLISAEADEDDGENNQKFVKIDSAEYLIALKVAIPGDAANAHNSAGDVTYMINTVAQDYWSSEFAGPTDMDDTDIDD